VWCVKKRKQKQKNKGDMRSMRAETEKDQEEMQETTDGANTSNTLMKCNAFIRTVREQG
jgi:hypothetical protein